MALLRCVLLLLLNVFANALVSSYACCSPLPTGRPIAPSLYRHPVSARLCVSENKLKRLENALAELCAAVLHADDVALLERRASGIGRVYMDGSFNMSRSPLMLRAAVRDVIVRYDLQVRPVQHNWLSHNHSQSL
jgi:hypothetical protein